jgi:uncharacterized protein YjbI with pentapeptide repeats
MANAKHVRLLKRSPAAWNRWSEKQERLKRLWNGQLVPRSFRADFSGADLRGTTLYRAELYDANLAEANLSGAKLFKANLVHADLRSADLSGADLTEADLTAANLCGARLHNTILWGADLTSANLCGADLYATALDHTILVDTDLTSVTGLDECAHTGPCVIEHRTLAKSGRLPQSFLKGCGLPDTLIDYLPSLFNEPIQLYSCFISHSHKDRAFARHLHNRLQASGIRCWLDERDLLVGSKIIDELDKAIRINDKFLLCCSEASLTSSWVEDEISMAIEQERQQRRLVLIPLLLDNYLLKGRPGGHAIRIRERLAADFTGWEHSNTKFEEQCERIVRALRAEKDTRGGALQL